MRAKRSRRRDDPVQLDDAAAALAAGHPTLHADDVARIVHHSRDLLAAIDPAHELLDERAVALGAERLDALDPSVDPDALRVLFLSTRNDGMSIIAEALVNAESTGVRATSAGVRPVGAVLRSVGDALAEVGATTIGFPKPLTSEVLSRTDLVVTMLCDAPPLHDGQRTEVWDFEDPAGLASGDVRALRDRIHERVQAFLAEVGTDR